MDRSKRKKQKITLTTRDKKIIKGYDDRALLKSGIVRRNGLKHD